MPKSLRLLLWISLALLALHRGMGAKCGGKSNEPTVRQTQVKVRSEGEAANFKVEVENKCPMCPIINLHLSCKGFTQSLVDPTLLRVLSAAAGGDCVVNDGLPLGPMQTLSFNYSSVHAFPLRPAFWSFQCE